MRTPKFNQADVTYILQLLQENKPKEVAKIVGTSLMTIYKIKNGVYIARVSEVSGLTNNRPGMLETLSGQA